MSALARRYPMSFAAVQKHVAVLEGAGLVIKQRKGREQLVSGHADTMRKATRLLEQLELSGKAGSTGSARSSPTNTTEERTHDCHERAQGPRGPQHDDGLPSAPPRHELSGSEVALPFSAATCDASIRELHREAS